MKVPRVLFVSVIRRQIRSAAKPENVGLILRLRDEEPNVHVHRGHVRVARMKYQRHAERLEVSSGQLGPLRAGRRRQGLADDVREADTAALEQIAVLDDARQSAAAQLRVGRLFPHVVPERLAVEPLERVDDALLQAEQILAND